jgi:hypothetical protein
VETAVGARREMDLVPAVYWAKFCGRREGVSSIVMGKRQEKKKTNRVGVAGLDVGLGVVLADADRDDVREGSSDLREVRLADRHRLVVKLVRQDDGTLSREGTVGSLGEDVVL